MDSISKSDKKSMKDGSRKVRCPNCLKLLIEPTNLPLYRCGYCNTILQAKYYKGPVNPNDSLVPSETLTSLTNTAYSDSEVNAPTEKIESVFLSKPNLTDEHTVETSNVKDEASEHGGVHSDLNLENSYEIGEITKNKEGITGKVISDQTEKSIMMDPVDGWSSLSAIDAESRAVFGRDSPQTNLEQGGCEVDGLMQKSEVTLLNGLLPSDVNMMDMISSKDVASEPGGNPSHFNSVPCHHQRNEIESEESCIHAINFGEQVKTSLIIESTESQSKCSSTISGSSSPASGRDFTLLDGIGVDSSVQKSEFVLLEEQKLSEGEMGDILSLKDEISELNSNTSHFTLLDGGPGVDDSEKKNEFVLLEGQKSSEVEMGDRLSLKDKISVPNDSTSHFTLIDRGPGVDDSEQKSEFELLEEQNSSEEDMGDLLSLKDTISEHKISTSHFTLLRKSEYSVLLEEQKSSEKEMGDILSLKDNVSEHKSSTSHFPLLDGHPGLDDSEHKSKFVLLEEQKSSEGEMEDVLSLKDKISELNSSPTHLNSEKSHDKPNTVECQEYSILATNLCERVETNPIQEKNELESKCLPSVIGVSYPTVSEISSSTSNEKIHDKPNTIGGQDDVIQATILCKSVEPGPIQEKNELECKCLPSASGVSSPDGSEIMSQKTNIFDNGTAVDEPQCQERKVNFESPTNKENTNIASDMQAMTHTYHGFAILERPISSDIKEEHVQSRDFEIVVDVLEVDKLESKQFQSVSHSNGPPESRNNSLLNKSDDGYMAVDLKENIEDIHTLGTISLKGDACESSSSLQSPEKQYQGSGETWISTEVKNKSTGLNMQVMNNTSNGILGLDNSRSCNIEVEREESCDNAIVEEVNTVDRGHGRAYVDDKFLSIRTRHKHKENVSSVEGGREDPPSQLSHLSRRSVGYLNASGSLSSMNKDEVRARQVNDSHERIPARKVLQGRHGLDAMSNLALNRNEPSSRNVVHGSFPRKPSGVPDDYHSVQNWIESKRAELLRSLSRFSDSTEFDRERMEILNKIDELRQLLGSSSLTRERNSMSYLEGRSHYSRSSFSESEYEYSHYSPSFSRHQHDVRSVVAKENQLIERTQSPRSSFHGLHHSPQRFPHPTPCIHSNCVACCNICSQSSNNDGLQCKFHSRIIQRNNHQFERIQKKEREYDAKRYCRPILGAAHFVSCHECFHVVQIPEHFDFVASRYKQLRCGFCREILEFSVLGNTQIVPYPRETRESYRQGDRVSSSSEDRSRSLDMSYSSRNHEHTSHVSTNRNMPVGRRDRKQPPLHTLMGYGSARDIIFQVDN